MRAAGLLAAVLATGTSFLVVSPSPPPDPLAQARPTADEIARSVIDIELHVSDVELDGSVTDVARESTEGATTVVTLASDILFAFGSAELSPAARTAVADLGTRVADQAGDVSVVGHTDSVGTDADNLVLSGARAQAVADVLVATIGDGSPGVVAEGKGESQPVASEEQPGGAALNRRVEVRFGG